MSRADLLLKLDEKFQDKYSLLRLNSVLVKKEINQVDISFYYIDPFFDENKSEISDYLISILPKTFTYKINFVKNYIDVDVIKDYVKSYLSKNHPFLFKGINDKTIDVQLTDTSAFIKLSFDTDSYSLFLEKNNPVNKLIEALFDRFPLEFMVDIFDIGPIDHSKDEERLMLKKQKIEQSNHEFKNRVIAIEPTEEFIGSLIMNLPNYIADFVEPCETVCVCGTIENCVERVAKSGQKFKTFVLNDSTATINAVAFESKTNPNYRVGFAKIDNGISIVVIGSINNDKFGKGLQLICNKVSRCYIPIDFKPVRKPSKPAPFYYLNVKPTRYIEESQINAFDDNKPIDPKYMDKTFVCFDLETTGLEANDSIIDIGAYKIVNGEITEVFKTFVNPKRHIPTEIVELTGITDDDVKDAPTIDEVIGDFCKFTEDAILVGHNVSFDIGYIKRAGKNHEFYFYNETMDTLSMSNLKLPHLYNHKLNTVCKHFNIELVNHHRATDDALACAKIFINLLKL